MTAKTCHTPDPPRLTPVNRRPSYAIAPRPRVAWPSALACALLPAAALAQTSPFQTGATALFGWAAP